MNNRELIDAQIEHAQQLVNSQAHQLKGLAEERTSHATGLVKQYVGDYSNRAQEYIGNRRSTSPEVAKAPIAVPPPAADVKKEAEPEPLIKTSDFPDAPRDEPVAQSIEKPQSETKPLVAA